MARAMGAPNSRINGVQIGIITYSFRELGLDLNATVKATSDLGINAVELMSNTVEGFAGAPGGGGMGGARRGAGRGPGAGGPPAGGAPGAGRAPGGGRAPMTPEQQAAMKARQEELRNWRLSAPTDKFREARKKFDDAGIAVRLLCFNMQDSTTDDEVNYAFEMAKALGVEAMTTSTTVSMSKRIAPLADKHKMMVGYHGHDQTSDPNQFATLDSYATAFSYSKYNGVNLDIGHFTASNYDAPAFIRKHHARITNLHIKDRKKDHGANVPWGQGDTPIKEVLQLMKKEQYPFPANIEYEYRGDDVLAELAKCLQYCKDALS
jgi:sugar phosphate isomerase/epimerase